MRVCSPTLVAVLIAIGACGETRPESGQFSGGFGTGGASDPTGAASDTGEAEDSSGAVDSSEADGGPGGPKLDVAGADDGIDPEMGCTKADFLFVIDSSGSMGDNQTNLIGSFPGFIETIRATLEGQDYHIMVVDTDGEDICDGTCNGGAPFCALGGFDCADVPALSGCDVALGAGDTRDVMKQPCPIDDGLRYMTQDQTDLEGTFACAARVGTYGDGNEQPMGALMAALDDAMSCNDGFLRDDAILVVTVLTDAPPQTAAEQVAGDPQQWHDAVVAAKNGDESAVSVLGLVSDGDVAGGLCSGNADDSRHGAPKLREFVQLFERNVLDSVCQPDYTAFFATAVEIVDKTCDEFMPEG